MEYHCSNDKNVSSRIFEKGLDLFSSEVDFVLRYLGFLISMNDENSKCSQIWLYLSADSDDMMNRCACALRENDWNIPSRTCKTAMGPLGEI